MLILDAENIDLPNVNKRSQFNRKTGKYFTASEYRERCECLFYLMKQKKIKSPYKIHIEVETYMDIDNLIKPLFDTMQKKGIIDDDRNIKSFSVDKTKRKRDSKSSIKVYVENIKEIEPWQ